jgi:hypothetical protein
VTPNTSSTVVAAYQNATHAGEAVQALRQAGFTDAHIGVLTPHEEARIKAAEAREPPVASGFLASVVNSIAGKTPHLGPAETLIALDIPEEDARYYESQLKTGATLLTVKADGRYDEAWSILQAHGGFTRQIPPATVSGSAGS